MACRIQLATGLFAGTILLMAAAAPARAEDAKITPPPGCQVKYIKIGDKKVPFFVREEADPISGVAPPQPGEKYEPGRVFSHTSALANKTFEIDNDPAYSHTVDLTQKQEFATKPFAFGNPEDPAITNKKSALGNTTFTVDKPAKGFEQAFAIRAADFDLDKASSPFSKITSPDQDRMATIGDKKVETPTDPMADKVFQGPEADAAHKSLTRLDNGQIYVSDLPDRPLSIEEVKNLINHGFKPDTSKAALDDTKPLNDPDYQPEPLRIEPNSSDTSAPAPNHAKDDDKDDAVPPPGTMTPPENDAPLPKQ